MLLSAFLQYISLSESLLLAVIATAVSAYLLGSINFSIIITRRAAKMDIRDVGSGNAGFTNVMRTVGKKPAVLTMLLDFLKCIIAVAIGILLFGGLKTSGATHTELIGYGKYLSGVFCILGHMFPCYFGFRGGKGVVTSCAMILMIDWRVWLILCAVFLTVFFIKGIVSLGSIIGISLFPVATFCFGYFVDYRICQKVGMTYVIISTLMALFVAAIIVIRHKNNIVRLLNGTETKITPKDSKKR